MNMRGRVVFTEGFDSDSVQVSKGKESSRIRIRIPYDLTVTSFLQLLFPAQLVKNLKLSGVGSADGLWTSSSTTGRRPAGFPAARA